jgi:D-alanine-D-alanine ligase
MKKIRVAVLMGGIGVEREVSLVSGKSVVAALDKEKYEAVPIEISADGKRWQLMDLRAIESSNPTIGREEVSESLALIKEQEKNLDLPKTGLSVEVVFIALHGKYGEDGAVQGLLDYIGAPYTGSGVLASAIGMNKVAFKRAIDHLGVKVPKWQIYEEEAEVELPAVIKPVDQGSSVGVSIVRNKDELTIAIAKAKKYSKEVLIEEYIKGVEVSAGILGNKRLTALPLVEICPKNEFFDYEAKYTEGMCEEIVPARISENLTKEIQRQAMMIYATIGCRGFGRVDFIIRDEVPYALEINTIPGLTPNSLLPKEARAMGITYAELLDKIIDLAMENN